MLNFQTKTKTNRTGLVLVVLFLKGSFSGFQLVYRAGPDFIKRRL